jgi:hypothetical protein
MRLAACNLLMVASTSNKAIDKRGETKMFVTTKGDAYQKHRERHAR